MIRTNVLYGGERNVHSQVCGPDGRNRVYGQKGADQQKDDTGDPGRRGHDLRVRYVPQRAEEVRIRTDFGGAAGDRACLLSVRSFWWTASRSVGDPERRAGIILAACPMAKKRGVITAERIFQARAKCPDLVVIRPRMQRYITISLLMTEIFESVSDLVEPYSIDEQFVDVTGSIGGYGSAEEIALYLQHYVQLSTGVRSRIGIGPSKILAKMATRLSKWCVHNYIKL
jgi:hypothetical protein